MKLNLPNSYSNKSSSNDNNRKVNNSINRKSQLNITGRSWQSVIELCEIRDDLSSCEALSNGDVCKIISLICLE